MKLSNLLITSMALVSTLVINTSKAADKIVIEEVGHLNYAEGGANQRQVASATTIISKIFRNKAIVKVSQSFTNNSQQTINGEYFFPLPYNSNLLDFQLSTDFQSSNDMPDTTVTLAENDQLSVNYKYELVDDSPYHASVMGFPAKQNLPLIEANNENELVAKK